MFVVCCQADEQKRNRAFGHPHGENVEDIASEGNLTSSTDVSQDCTTRHRQSLTELQTFCQDTMSSSEISAAVLPNPSETWAKTTLDCAMKMALDTDQLSPMLLTHWE